MATIPGSQFTATASLPINVVETTTGTGLPPTVPGAFNLEVYVGSTASAPSVTPGYDGLAVLTPGGFTIDLVSGSYAVTDNGSGDTLNVDGTNETVIGGANFSNLILNGNNDAAVGGAGGNFIAANGTGDTVTGGSGTTVINVMGSGDVVHGGSGMDVITAIGSNETISGGTGPDIINAIGANEMITGGAGNDTIGLFNSGDTVTAGSGNMSIFTTGANFQFNDSANLYADTVTGFSEAAGDHIHLTGGDTVANTQVVNSGQDTLITLSDNSTILLKGITSIDHGFFN